MKLSIQKFLKDKFGFPFVRFVENKEKKTKADSYYMHVYANGDNFLFTKEQLTVAKRRATKNPEDVVISWHSSIS